MKLNQLSIFLENKPGALHAATQVIADAGLNLLTVSLADTTQFGILRFIVDDTDRAKQALQDAGMVVRVTEVVPIEVADEPGGLAKVLAAVEAADLSVEYMYLFGASCRPGSVAIIFRFEDPDAALPALTQAGVRVLSSEELLTA